VIGQVRAGVIAIGCDQILNVLLLSHSVIYGIPGKMIPVVENILKILSNCSQEQWNGIDRMTQ
jgi:hypothetical protein